MIAVEQKKDDWGLGEPLDLVLEELSAKKRDRIGEACLIKAHGGPWAFDHNNSPVSEGLGTVGVVEDVGLGEVFWEAPFAETSDLIGKEEACAVAQGTAMDVVKAHGHGVSQESGAPSGARLEEVCGIGRDLLDFLEKVSSRIEGDGASEGFEGR